MNETPRTLNKMSEIDTSEKLMKVILLDLPHALTKNQFYLVFQPIVDVSEGVIVSYEALIRWNHPTIGLISPGDFIPIAEKLGFISDIDLWVLNTVVKLDFKAIPVHVNLSGYDLTAPGFLENLVTVVEEKKDAIILEFTETAQIDFSSQLIQTIKGLGLRLAIDDFGTGYSSMLFLNTLKVHMLKIDIYFVQNMLHDIDSAVITNNMIRLANSLNMEIIAEGVETHEQLQHLYRNGCRLIQGYFISRPLLYADLDKFDATGFKLEHQEKFIDDTDDFIKKYANNPLILLELDEDLHYIHITDNFCTYLGYSMAALKGKTFFDLIAPEHLEAFNFMLQSLKISHYIDNVILNLIRKDHSLKSTIFTARIDTRKPHSIIVYLEDHTSYSEKIDEINGVRNAYSVMFHHAPLTTIVWNTDYEIVDWNSEATATFGWLREEAIGKNLIKLLEPFDKNFTPQVFEETFSENVVENIYRIVTKERQVIICRWINRSMRDADGKVRFIISMVTDITQDLLKNDNIRMLSAAIEKIGSAVVITDNNGMIEYTNSLFNATTGYGTEIIGEKISILATHEQSDVYYKTLWETISSGSTWIGEFHNRKKDGTLYWCKTTIVPITSTVNGQLRFIGIQEDITEQLRKDAQLSEMNLKMREHELLASLGAMLTGIIHEINHPLTTIISNVQFLATTYTQNATATEVNTVAFEDIQTSLSHLSKLLTTYKKLIEGDTDLKFSHFDIHEAIESVLSITRNEYKYEIMVEYKNQGSLFIYGSPVQMRQVIMNLLINAIYAVKKRSIGMSGNISIELSSTEDHLRFEMRDNGIGVESDILPHVFEPFFTTKSSVEGTGLGLSICKDIIETSFKGTLGVRSDKNETVFYFDLPLVHDDDTMSISTQ